MPVKIRHKQLGDIESVDYEKYFHNYMNNDLYETIELTDIYELYNRKDGPERWQTTLERDNAYEALKKHPDIFRIEYSDKNTRPQTKSIYEKSLNDLSIINVEQTNQLRDDGTEDSIKKTSAAAILKEPTLLKQRSKWPKIISKISENTPVLIVTILGTVIGTLLVIMIVNYCNHKGFVIK